MFFTSTYLIQVSIPFSSGYIENTSTIALCFWHRMDKSSVSTICTPSQWLTLKVVHSSTQMRGIYIEYKPLLLGSHLLFDILCSTVSTCSQSCSSCCNLEWFFHCLIQSAVCLKRRVGSALNNIYHNLLRLHTLFLL